jgi:hypothetical protein
MFYRSRAPKRPLETHRTAYYPNRKVINPSAECKREKTPDHVRAWPLCRHPTSPVVSPPLLSIKGHHYSPPTPNIAFHFFLLRQQNIDPSTLHLEIV